MRFWVCISYINRLKSAPKAPKILGTFWTFNKKKPLLWQHLEQGGVFLLKVQNLPKISAPSAPILAYLYRKYTPKTSFLSFLAPQAKMLSIFARFLSDFAVRNDDFQRKNSNPSQIFRSVQISESAKTRGGFLIIITTDVENYRSAIIIQLASKQCVFLPIIHQFTVT